MAIKLRNGEVATITAHFHWSSYLFFGVWAGICTLSLIGQAAMALFSKEPSGPVLPEMVFTAFIGLFPLGIRILANYCKHYVLTNDRLYVEEGILSKSKKDIPIHKMNDIEMSQGIIQRIFGAGNILVLTGNDKPTRLKNIDCPEEFKNQLTQAIKNKSTKTAVS